MFSILNIDSKWAHFVNKTIRKVIAITDFCQIKLILTLFIPGFLRALKPGGVHIVHGVLYFCLVNAIDLNF